jgi:hypothetical protein
MTDIDASIDRLTDALRGAGFNSPAAPRDTAPLESISAAVAPYGLPAELRRFWERVDPATIAITVFPELIGPRAALELHRAGLDPAVSPPTPPLLFPFAYSSHVFRSIELASEWGDGGTIFQWADDEDAFQLAYRNLGELLETIGELIEEGRLAYRGGFVLVGEAVDEGKEARLTERSGPHPLYGHARELGRRDFDSWPPHWLEASGIDLGARRPLGATHSIAELILAAETGPVRGRIAGTVVSLTGIGVDALVVLDDGTRSIEIWCPAGASHWPPVHRARFEFEVTNADAETGRGEGRPAVLAIDVRPLD